MCVWCLSGTGPLVLVLNFMQVKRVSADEQNDGPGQGHEWRDERYPSV